jgi:hypothetical protein
VDAALKKQLLAATDERFVISIKDRTHGFALIRTRTLIRHLYDTYGNITSEDLSANEDRMKAAWDPTTPIEGLFEQIDDGTAYATAGNDPFTITQLVRFAYNIIESNGCMSLACRDWRQLPRNDHTWTCFKTNFKAAHLDLRLTATTNSAGYHGQAHHTAIHNSDNTPLTPADNTDNQAITQAYLANLAEATLANNTQVSALTATVAQLKLQISTATTALMASQTALQAANTTRSSSSSSTPRRSLSHIPAAARHYCWTHDSTNCGSQATGHQPAATFINHLGGTE